MPAVKNTTIGYGCYSTAGWQFSLCQIGCAHNKMTLLTGFFVSDRLSPAPGLPCRAAPLKRDADQIDVARSRRARGRSGPDGNSSALPDRPPARGAFLLEFDARLQRRKVDVLDLLRQSR